MSKTGSVPVLVRHSLDRKNRQEQMNKHTITNCSTCSKGNKYGVVTENNGGEDSLN